MKITTIRFNLKFFNADGEEEVVRTLDDLRDKFNLSDLYEYFKAGDLSRWLRGLNESEMADQVDSLKSVSDRRQTLERLCNALGMPIPKEAIADYCNMLERQKKMKSSRHREREDKLRVDKREDDIINYISSKSVLFFRERDDDTLRVRAYLAGLYDERQKHDLVNRVIRKLMGYNYGDEGGITVFGALLFNNAWREFMKRFYDIKATIHVRGGECRKMIVAVVPKDMSESQLQRKTEFKFGNSFPRYFPIFGFDFDIITSTFVAESISESVVRKPSGMWGVPHDYYSYGRNEEIIDREVDSWKRDYLFERWGNAVPSWEERKAETEEMLKQWMQKHFYWN